MQNVSNLFAAVVVIISLLFHESLSQYENSVPHTLPPVPCPDVFKYQLEGNSYVGIVTLRGVTYGQTTLEVGLTQPGANNIAIPGELSLNIKENEIFDYLQQGRPVTYRVRFPLRNVVPRVTEITVNNVRICSGPTDRLPKTTMRLMHSLNVNRGPVIVTRHLPSSYNHYAFVFPASEFSYRPPSISTPVVANRDYTISEQNPFLRFHQQQRSKFNNTTQNLHRSISGNTPPLRTSINLTPEIATKPTTPNNIHSVCGQENSIDVEGLVNVDKAVSRSRYPWMASIFSRNISSLVFMCGGSLISTKTVIGAAHCFPSSISVDSLLLSLGRNDLSEWQDALNVTVQRIIKHPDFGKEALSHDADVAILQLKERVRFSPLIRPICLWDGPTDDRAIEGTMGSIVGWGMDAISKRTSALPKLVEAKIVSELTCIRSKEEFLYSTSNRTLCAGNRDGSGPCLGDSGSGLMIQKDNKWMLRGTVSAALGGVAKTCNLNEYVIYADIAKFNDWIRGNMLQ